jgi:ABC-type transport system involved in multi-copper enzyme maturation permease subunit
MPAVPPVLVFAKLTVWEASRRKLLLALVVLTVLVVVGTGWAFSTLWRANGAGGQPLGEVQVRLIASQILVLVVFLFAAVLALTAVVVAAPSISGDLESNLALAMLARPVRRSELLLGRWLGLAVLLVVYATVAGVMELIVVDVATGYVPPQPVQLIAYTAGVGLILLTLTLLLSTRMSGMTAGIIPLACYFMAWIGGIVGGVGEGLNNNALIAAGVVSKLLLPTDGLWRGAVYAMEPASVVASLRAAGPFLAANPFAAAYPPPAPFLAWTAGWFLALIGLALWSFRAREV